MASLTDDSRGIIYNCNLLIVQVRDSSAHITYKCTCLLLKENVFKIEITIRKLAVNYKFETLKIIYHEAIEVMMG